MGNSNVSSNLANGQEEKESVQREREDNLRRREHLAQLEREEFEKTSNKEKNERKHLSREQTVSYILEELLEVSLNGDRDVFNLKKIRKDLFDKEKNLHLLTVYNVQDLVIFEVISSNESEFFAKHEDKINYLLLVMKRTIARRKEAHTALGTSHSTDQVDSSVISDKEYEEILQTTFNYLITITKEFRMVDIEGVQEENQDDIFDTRNVLLDALYNQYQKYGSFVQEDFLERLAQHDDLDFIMTSFLKRIYNSMRLNGTVENMSDFTGSIERLKQLFSKDQLLDHFLNKSVLFDGQAIQFGIQMQENTIFGLMLSLTTFPDEWGNWHNHFKPNPSLDANDKKVQGQKFLEEIHTIRHSIQEFHSQLFGLLHSIARKRNSQVLLWIEKILALNKGILKTYHITEHCAQPGFIFNFMCILLRFSSILTVGGKSGMTDSLRDLDIDVIVEPTGLFKVYDRIISLESQSRIANSSSNISSDTHQNQGDQPPHHQGEQLVETSPIQMQVEVIEEKKEMEVSGEDGNLSSQNKTQNTYFYSKIYRFAMASIHLNLPLFRSLRGFIERYHQASHIHNPLQQQHFNRMQQQKNAYLIQIDDPLIDELISNFLELEVLLSYKLNKQNLTQDGSILSLQTISQTAYAQLPFFFVEDMAEYLSLKILYFQHVSLKNRESFQKIIDFQLLVIGYKSWCSNPHFRMKTIEVFSMMAGLDKTMNTRNTNCPSTFLHSSKIFQRFLIPCLLRVFVEMEKQSEGNHPHQIEERLFFRFHLCRLFTYMIETEQTNPNLFKEIYYSTQLISLSKDKKGYFLEFANMFFNDPIFLLDLLSAKMCKVFHFGKIARGSIHAIVYLQKEEEARQCQQQVRKLSQFLVSYYKNIEILSLFTEDIFLQDEVKSKLANFIHISFIKIFTYHHIDELILPQAQKDFNFDLQAIVGHIIHIYLKYSQYEKFLESLVEDTRVFEIDAFVTSIAKFQSLRIITVEETKSFMELSEKIIKVYNQNQQRDALLYVDVPEKYLDPLLSQIMMDPVRLPKSEVIIDRVTIVKHLLNDKSDPFTRDLLNEEDLIPLPDLKAEIEEFVRIKLIEKKQKDKQNIETPAEEKMMIESESIPDEQQPYQDSLGSSNINPWEIDIAHGQDIQMDIHEEEGANQGPNLQDQ